MVGSTQPRGVPQEAGASSSCCCFLGPLRGSSIEVHSVFGSGGHHEAEQCSLVLRMRIRETRKGRTVWLALGSSGHHIGSHNSEVQLGLYQCCPLALSLSHYSRLHSKPHYIPWLQLNCARASASFTSWWVCFPAFLSWLRCVWLCAR